MSLSNGKIKAIIILEVLGRPPEHLKETLEAMVKKIGEEKGVKITSSKINEATPLKEKSEFFTSFAEIEVELGNLMLLSVLMFKYMPAHVEVLSPEDLSLTNNDINELFNELTRRLHGYDEIARVVMTEKKILEKKLKEALEGKEDSKESKK